MKRQQILLLVFLLVINMSYMTAVSKETQPEATLKEKPLGAIIGFVLDASTQSPLSGVNILVKDTRKGTTTNKDGEFLLSKIEPGEYTLVFEFIGYARKVHERINVFADQETDLKNITLEEKPIDLKEIVVTPGSYSIMGETAVRQAITSEDIKMMGWAEDVVRAVQRVPGISGNDFTAKFNIRGGDVDEVLFLLDGMQIYNPFHQKDFGGGLFTTIDIETIEGIDLLTGGFTADYGDRMSGVLNMKTKRPDEGERTSSVGFSLMNVRGFSMGSFDGDKGAWLVSFRRGYLGILNALMADEFKWNPSYYDMLVKLEYKIHSKHSLSVHAFLAKDSYSLEEVEFEPGLAVPNFDMFHTKFGNNYGWITLNSFLTPKVHARTIFYRGLITQNRDRDRLDNDPQAHLNSHNLTDKRDFKLVGIKEDLSIEASENIFVKMGFEFREHDVTFDYFRDVNNEFLTSSGQLVNQVDTVDVKKNENGGQLGIYLSGRFRLASPLTLETGMRYDETSHTPDRLWSPRVGLIYQLAPETFIRAGWGYYYQTQAIENLRIEYGENDYNEAELAKHYTLGLEHRFDNGLHLRAEGYFKDFSNLRSQYVTFRNIDEFFPETRDDLINIIAEKATTKGLELYVKYDTGNKVSWWLSYVLSDATDDVTAMNYDGPLIKQTGEVPRVWDQRHTINMDVNYRPNRNWHFNIAWQYRTGWPSTPFEVVRVARGDGTFAFYHNYGEYNSENYPAYHRLDTRINRYFYTSTGKITAFVHIINAYNHTNVNNYDYGVEDPFGDNFNYHVEAETWFGFIPFFGVSWEF